MISCSEAVRQLWGYLEEDLHGDDRARLEEHLAFCRRCCGELEFAKELQEVLRAKTAAVLPDDVQDRLERFIEELDDGTATGERP